MSGEYPDRDPQMFYELARDRHASQAALLDSLDSKLGLFLTGSSALIGILLAVLALRPNAFDTLAVVVLTASGFAWLALTTSVLHALWRTRWRSGPDLLFVYRLHASEDDRSLKWRAANVFWHDYNWNRKYADRKGRSLLFASRVFVIQTLLLVLAFALVATAESDTTRRLECPEGAASTAQVAPPEAIPPAAVPAPPRTLRERLTP